MWVSVQVTWLDINQRIVFRVKSNVRRWLITDFRNSTEDATRAEQPQSQDDPFPRFNLWQNFHFIQLTDVALKAKTVRWSVRAEVVLFQFSTCSWHFGLVCGLQQAIRSSQNVSFRLKTVLPCRKSCFEKASFLLLSGIFQEQETTLLTRNSNRGSPMNASLRRRYREYDSRICKRVVTGAYDGISCKMQSCSA